MHWLSWEPLCEPNFMYVCIKSSIGTQAWGFVFGLARRGSIIGFHVLGHTIELAMSTLLCLS